MFLCTLISSIFVYGNQVAGNGFIPLALNPYLLQLFSYVFSLLTKALTFTHLNSMQIHTLTLSFLRLHFTLSRS